jgi:hypothetical protein
LGEHETEVRNCLRKGAHKVQIDFTEGRLAVKIDPTGRLLHRFIDLNNLALASLAQIVLAEGVELVRRAVREDNVQHFARRGKGHAGGLDARSSELPRLGFAELRGYAGSVENVHHRAVRPEKPRSR